MIAQAVNLMNFLKGLKQFIIPVYQRTLTKDASALPDLCICALFYTQTFERNVDNGGALRVMIWGIKLKGECNIQETILNPTLERTYQLDRKDYTP